MFGCMEDAKEGVIIKIHTIPGSKSSKMSYIPLEKRLKVRVSSPAMKGKANREIIGIFSTLFGNCEIVSGMTSRKKTLLIRGKRSDALKEILTPLLD